MRLSRANAKRSGLRGSHANDPEPVSRVGTTSLSTIRGTWDSKAIAPVGSRITPTCWLEEPSCVRDSRRYRRDRLTVPGPTDRAQRRGADTAHGLRVVRVGPAQSGPLGVCAR